MMERVPAAEQSWLEGRDRFENAVSVIDNKVDIGLESHICRIDACVLSVWLWLHRVKDYGYLSSA